MYLMASCRWKEIPRNCSSDVPPFLGMCWNHEKSLDWWTRPADPCPQFSRGGAVLAMGFLPPLLKKESQPSCCWCKSWGRTAVANMCGKMARSVSQWRWASSHVMRGGWNGGIGGSNGGGGASGCGDGNSGCGGDVGGGGGNGGAGGEAGGGWGGGGGREERQAKRSACSSSCRVQKAASILPRRKPSMLRSSRR